MTRYAIGCMNLRLARIAARFARDRRGVSAVEFAMLLPLMIALYFGGVEMSQGIAIQRKVTLTTGTLANLSAQVSSISASDMTNIFNASTAILSPYATGPLKMTVSCLNIDANKNITVKWSVTQGGSVLTAGGLSVPSALIVANTQLLFSQVSYAYTPTVGYTITGSLTLSDKMYMSPRITAPTYVSTTCT